MLQEQIFQLPFSGGLDEKTQAELLEPGSLLTMHNAVHKKGGSIGKPFGLTALATGIIGGGNVAAAKRLLGRGDETCLIDGSWLYSWSPTAGAWSKVSRVPECIISERREIVATFNYPTTFRHIVINGFMLAVGIWSTNPTVQSIVLDPATGTALPCVDTNILAAGSLQNQSIRLLAMGNKAILIDMRGTGPTAYTLDMTSAATIAAGWSTGTILCTDMGITNKNQFGDAFVSSNTLYFAYINNSGGSNSITVRGYNSSLTLALGPMTLAAGVGPNAVGIGGDASDTLYVAWQQGTSGLVTAIGIGAGLGSTLATAATIITPLDTHERPTSLQWIRTASKQAILVAGNDSGNAFGFNLYIASTYYGFIGDSMHTGYNAGQSQSFAPQTRYRMHVDSAPFTMNGRYYLFVRRQDPAVIPTPSNTENMLTCIDITGNGNTAIPCARPVVSIAPRLAAQGTNPSTGPAVILQPVPGSATKLYMLHVVARAGSSVTQGGSGSASQSLNAALELATLDFAPTNAWQPATLGPLACLAGGTPAYYDGKRVAEIGFWVPPKITSISSPGGGGSLSGTYGYAAIYEQPDGTGQFHRSAPSAPVTYHPGAASPTITVNVASLQVTSRYDSDSAEATKNPVRIALYRTVDAGATYYRVGISLNDPTGDTIPFIDSTIDTDLTKNELLYTQPGTNGSALNRVCPSSFRAMTAHSDRIVGVGDDAVSLWPSGAHVIGEGPWFADAIQEPAEPGGPVTALLSIDGRLVIFKRGSIAVLDGSGPADAGGPGFSDPQYISTAIGCTEPRSLVITSMGAFFRSARGIELLNRGMSVENYVGRAVEDELASFPVVTSAVVSEAEGCVYFTCLASEGSASGRVLIYDMVFGSWSTMAVAAQSAALIGSSPGVTPVYTLATAAGVVLQQNPANYLDSSGAYVPTTVETPWIKLAGLQGYQRVRRVVLLARTMTPHDITISLGFDFAAGYVKSETFTAAKIAALGREELSVQVPPQYAKCQAVRVKIQDATPSSGGIGTGQGPALLGLAFAIGAKRGIRRLGATAKA